MNPISLIRSQLNVTQSALAAALGVSQGNVSHYEKGQGMPPDIAKRLIAFAASRGHTVTFDDIYGNPRPSSRRSTDPELPTGHAGRQPANPTNIADTLPGSPAEQPP